METEDGSSRADLLGSPGAVAATSRRCSSLIRGLRSPVGVCGVACAGLISIIWLIALSATVGRLQLGTSAAPAGLLPVTTNLAISSTGCGTFATSLAHGTPVSFSERQQGTLVIGAGTSSYVGAVKLQLDPSPAPAKTLLVTVDSSTAVVAITTGPWSQQTAHGTVVQNGGARSGSQDVQWLNGNTISAAASAGAAFPFLPDDGKFLSRPYPATNALIVYVGQGRAVIASVSGGTMIFGTPVNYTGSVSVDAKVVALDELTFAISFYNVDDTTQALTLRTVVGAADPQTFVISLTAPVTYAGNHNFHGLSRVLSNVYVLAFSADNGTAVVNDDDEEVGFPMGLLVATVEQLPAGTKVVQVWGSHGTVAAAGTPDQSAASPWMQLYVRAHSFFGIIDSPVPAQWVSVQSASAMLSVGGKGSLRSKRAGGGVGRSAGRKLWQGQSSAALPATQGVNVSPRQLETASGPLMFRQLTTLAIVDRAASDAIRAMTVEVYVIAQQGTTAPSQTVANVTSVDALFGDTLLVTPGGASGRYRGLSLASFPVLPVATVDTPSVHFAVTVVEMSAQAAATAHVYTMHTQDGRLSLPYSKRGSPSSVVDTTGVTVAPSVPIGDPVLESAPYLISSQRLPGTNNVLVATVFPGSGGLPATGNLSIVEHLPSPVGVIGPSSGAALACAPGQVASVVVGGATRTDLQNAVQPAGQPLAVGTEVYATTRGYLTTTQQFTAQLSSSTAMDVYVASDAGLGISLADGAILVG